MPADLGKLRTALALVFRAGLTISLKTLVRALHAGKPIDLLIALAAIRKMGNDAWKVQATMHEAWFKYHAGGSFLNFAPIRQLVAERQLLNNERIQGYSYLFRQSAASLLTIGRRTQDVVRELSLTTLERSMIYGEPATMSRQSLAKLMISRGRTDLAQAINAGLDPVAELTQNIPLFNKNGKPYFYLRKKSGGFMAFGVDAYAELIASTTSEEMDRMAQVEKARKLGTRLVKFNKTGKGKAFYIATKDFRCAKVDGETFSIEPGGTTINGRYYQYWRDALPGEFVTCHPNCQHFMRPVSEAAA